MNGLTMRRLRSLAVQHALGPAPLAICDRSPALRIVNKNIAAREALKNPKTR
jgi:hypothetical protein